MKTRENKGNNRKWLMTISEKIPRCFTMCFSIYMIVTLLLNVILNNRIYFHYRSNYLETPNVIWLGCAITILILAVFVTELCSRKMSLSESQFYLLIVVSFAIIYLIQLFISDNIYFKTGWDVRALREAAEGIALYGADGVANDYFCWYPNNIFAVYTLVFLYKIAITVHSQDPYFVIVAMNNLVVNISVLLAVLSIYKITKKQSVTMVSMLFGVILIGLSPWIVIPYTDTLGMLFPIGAVFCYVYFRNRYLRYFLFVVLCGIGYLYKPTVAIGLIALVIVKMFSVLRRVLRHRLKPGMVVKVAICVLVAVMWVAGLDKAVLGMNKTELDDEKAMTMTHYFMMGLNEESDGVYSEEDVNFSRSFENKAERKKGNMEVIKQRFQKMGIGGYIRHLAKKNIANYNDGTFAWCREGSFFVEMPEKASSVATFLRRFYWWDQAGDENLYQVFASIEQTVWYFVLLCIVCCIVPEKKENDAENLIALILIGVSLFLLLFECRARYLYIFSPLYVVLAGIGLNKASELYGRIRGKRNQKMSGTIKIP